LISVGRTSGLLGKRRTIDGWDMACKIVSESIPLLPPNLEGEVDF